MSRRERKRATEPALPSPRPWRADGLLILDAAGRVVASVATHAPVPLAVLEANAAAIVAAVNREETP